MMNRIIMMIAAWMMAVAVAVAQEATVKRVEMVPMDLSASKYMRNDLTGEPCALVKVEVLAGDVRYSGNVIGETEYRAGEYWVYMMKGSKMLRMNSSSFLPLMLYFADYGIDALQPSVTYVVTLSLPTYIPSQSVPSTIYTAAEEEAFVWYRDNDKWGFKDKSGKIIIPAKYDHVGIFSEGLAVVELNEKYGFIDSSDRMVIPAKYDYARLFSDGLAAVEVNGKYGFINKTDRMVIPAIYDDAYKFSDGVGIIKNNDLYGMIDKAGRTLLPPKYKWIFFTEGVGRVELNGKYGFVDNKGNFIIPLQYEEAGFFSEGLAAVKTNGKWGYVNKSGMMVIPARYTEAYAFNDGEAVVIYKGKIGIVDANNNFKEHRVEKYDITVSGTLTDESGEPLIGASVIDTIRKNGVVTDFDGHYTLTVKYGTPIVFSYVGFKSKTLIAEKSKLDVELIEIR